MVEHLSINKAKIQFLYPFRVNRWSSFRNGLEAFLDEQDDDLAGALKAAEKRLEKAYPLQVAVLSKARETLSQCLNGTHRCPNKRRSNASMVNELHSLVKKLQVFDHEVNNEIGQHLLCSELAELIREHEAKVPERIMSFLCEIVDQSGLPLIRKTEYRLGDDRGTRAYLERKQPFIDVRLKAENLAIENPDSLPDITQKLSNNSGLRLASNVRLLSTGFGCLRLKAHLANEEGLVELVNETVFSAPHTRTRLSSRDLHKREALAKELSTVIGSAVRYRSSGKIKAVLEQYGGIDGVNSIGDRLAVLIDQVTLVKGTLTVNDIIDVENLDRGFSRGHEPRLLRKGTKDALTLFSYFRTVADEVFLSSFRSALLEDAGIVEYVNRSERRTTLDRGDIANKEQFMGAIPNLALHGWSLALEEHPYVSTFVSAPSSFKKTDATSSEAAVRRYRSMVERHRNDLARIVMKSKWAEMRSDWSPATHAVENVFYSDLVHIAVHLRSTLCLYYTPANRHEYALFPELATACKYREELNDTLQRQRVLWYAYVTSDHLVTGDIRRISATLETLKEQSLKEEFPEVIEGLADVIRGIDRRKMAMAEIMEDPLSRKGGNSLFTEIIEKTSNAFHLRSLYDTLHDKVDRLDMLGIHVNQNVEEYSNLLVQEGTRSAQLTLEFLEAIVIGFYVSELAEVGLKAMKSPLEHEWWTVHLIAIGAFFAALPLITLIRKGRSRFSLKNPEWLERFEKVGIIVGPAILLTLLYLGLYIPPATEEHATIWTLIRRTEIRYSTIIMFIGAFLFTVLGWFQASEGLVSRYSQKLRRSLRFRRKFGDKDKFPPTQPQEAVVDVH